MDFTKESFDKRIACVIVTYNRKQLLKRCLDAVASQTYKPAIVYITDNASTDGTIDSVKDWGYYECVKESIQFKYILNSKNEGGAGGFYLGMKTAYEDNSYDGIWVMDDDGEPEKNCLKELVKFIGKYDYIAPIVLSDENHLSCSFDFPEENIDTIQTRMKVHDGIIDDWASPFNGILFSRKLISIIGFPKKEMFIWGDENNYHQRCIMHSFRPITVVSAIHYHPKDRQLKYATRNNKMINVPIEDWKLYCYIRNRTYNRKIHGFPWGVYGMIEEIRDYTYYFHTKGMNKTKIILAAIFDGYFERWDRINKYKK